LHEFSDIYVLKTTKNKCPANRMDIGLQGIAFGAALSLARLFLV
jgi:hypothetical protein